MAAPIVIVGAGQAGLQAAESLRAEGCQDDIVLVGDEPEPPYHRPPLSKGLLTGESGEDQLTIRGPEVLERKGIRHLGGRRVAAIDRDRRRVVFEHGDGFGYAGLVLATGARPRRLDVPGAGLAGVVTLRSLADARHIAGALPTVRDVVVVGGGFIGLEMAAAAAKRGATVRVLEAAPRLLARVGSPVLSDFYRDLHSAHGVALHLGATLAELVGEDGRVVGARTTGGAVFPADLVVVGIGVLPNTELAAAAGLACDRGILVDACARTDDAAIVAAGDCTARRDGRGGTVRLESVQNAVEQGKSAAAALLGRERPFAAVPWFWSDQFEAKLQMAGRTGGDRAVVRGDPGQGSFSTFLFEGETLIGVESVNQPREHMTARKLLDRGVSPSFDQAADAGFGLDQLLKGQTVRPG